MGLQLVRPVELLIAARVASVMTVNAGEQHESTEDQCINRSTTLLFTSTPWVPQCGFGRSSTVSALLERGKN